MLWCRPVRAAAGWLVAAGQGRGTWAALDPDARVVADAPAERAAAGVQGDCLGVGPGDEHGRGVPERPAQRVGAERDTGHVGAEGDLAAGYGDEPGHGGQDEGGGDSTSQGSL
jgi:hypothetical protein